METPIVKLYEKEPRGENFGYGVSVSIGKRGKVEYENWAVQLDKCWFLKEKYGDTNQDIYQELGIVVGLDNKDKAQKRLYDKAKKEAEQLVKSLKPKLEDLTLEKD